MERVDANPHVEGILPRCLRNVLVGANTCSFESLARELFVLVGHKMAAKGEIIDRGTLTAQVEDTNLSEMIVNH